MKSRFRVALLAASLACAALPLASLAQAPAGAKPAAPAPAAAKPAAAASGPAANTAEWANAGKAAAQGWLVLLDRRDWGTAWDTTGQAFRQTVPLPNWMDAIPKVRQPFGALVERQAVEAIYKTSLPGRPEGQYVSVLFNTKFEKQAVQEVVTTMRDTDGRFRVIGYSPKPN